MEFCSIRFKVWSSGLEPLRIDLDEDDWLKDYDPDLRYSKTVNIKVIGVYDDMENDYPEVEIGYIEGTFIDIEGIEEDGYDMFDVFDSISQEVYNVYAAITYRKGNIEIDCVGYKINIFILERLYIDKEYRNKGIGKKVLNLLEELLKYSLNMDIGCFVLLPKALEKNEQGMLQPVGNTTIEIKLTKRLVRFYERAGFKKLRGNSHMYKNTDYI